MEHVDYYDYTHTHCSDARARAWLYTLVQLRSIRTRCCVTYMLHLYPERRTRARTATHVSIISIVDLLYYTTVNCSVLLLSTHDYAWTYTATCVCARGRTSTRSYVRTRAYSVSRPTAWACSGKYDRAGRGWRQVSAIGSNSELFT